MKQRAIADADKELRRHALLDAGRRLFQARPRQLPTVAAIAEDCRLAKGTVYLYFRSKEEIFIALLADDFDRLFAGIAALPMRAASVPEFARIFCDAYLAFLAAHPEFLRLAAMASSVLEQTVAPDVVLAFKTRLADGLQTSGSRLEAAMGLAPASGAQLLLQTYALTLGLWQAYDLPPALENMLSAPALQVLRPDFARELPLAISRLWIGAATLPS